MNRFAWANETIIHPIGLSAFLVLALAMLVLPRRYALVPIALMACLMSSRQRIVIATLDFTYLRLLVIVGWMRVMARGELPRFRLLEMDWAFVTVQIATMLLTTLRTQSLAMLSFTLGNAIDALGTYFLARALIRTRDDLLTLVRAFAVIAFPVAVLFVIESHTGRNLFSVFGGVPEYTLVREGKLRCQGAFPHPILAGCFWVSLLPFFAALWWQSKAGKAWALYAIPTALVIIMLCHSSTPLMGVAATLLGASFFVVRTRMRLVRRGLVVALILIQLMMEKPIWHLISRIDLVGGSTGWQRYHLIDQAVRRIGEWGFWGTNDTSHWGHAMRDVANQYLVVGTQGGLLALIAFIAGLVFAYRYVGRMRRLASSRRDEILAWAFGVCLFAHTLVFLAVSYFGQIVFIWSLQLGAISALYAAMSARGRRRAAASSRVPPATAPTNPLGPPVDVTGARRWR